MTTKKKQVKESQTKGKQAAIEARKAKSKGKTATKKKMAAPGTNPCTKLPHTEAWRKANG